MSGDQSHRDSEGSLLRCCNPKLKKPSDKYPLHAEYALKRYGMTSQEYDRIFAQRDQNGQSPNFRVGCHGSV